MTSTDTRAAVDWLIAAALAIALVAIAWMIRTSFHGWGDDFAVYMLQAKAIDAGALHAEVAMNTHVLALSDAPVGPPAAPWGFPVLLWLAAKVVGWQINPLKVVGIVSIGVFAGSSYLLARNYLSRFASITVAAFMALQPDILGSGDSLGADMPFLAAATLALLVGEQFVTSPDGEARFRPWLTLLASALVTVGFSIRSNGAFLAVALFAILACVAWTSTGAVRRSRLYEMALLTFATTVLFVVYLKGFPDGSLYHARLLTTAPDVVHRRLSELAAGSAEFVPFSVMRRLHLLHPAVSWLTGALVVALAAIGAWRHRERSSGLVVFALLNLALLLIFPADGGARYLFPVLVPAVVLCAAGLSVAVDRLSNAKSMMAYRSRIAVAVNVALAATIAGMLAIVPVVFHGPPDAAVSGPLTPASDSLFTFVKERVPAGKTVSFFKPRALRLFTGKVGIAITRAADLGRADYVVLDKRAADGRWEVYWQLDRQTVESYDGGHFGKIYENGQFLVYGAADR